MHKWILETNGPAYWLVNPHGERTLILLRMELASVSDFELYAQTIVNALNERERNHDK